MEMFITKKVVTQASVDLACMPGTAMRVFAQARTPNGMPFFLDGDGRYIRPLNDFLRALPDLGCISANTWRAYALDLAGLLEFLQGQDPPRGLMTAKHADLKAYKGERRLEAERPVGAGTWNRAVSAFDKFYHWAKDENLRGDLPFSYRRGRKRGFGMALVNTLYEPNGVDDRIKCVSLEDYKDFREVGLRGMLPDRTTRDPDFQRRNAERNALMADVLLNTGMRITEFSSLLRMEIPRLGERSLGRGASPVRVAPHTTKRRKGRTVMVSNGLVTRIANYLAVDRADAVITGRSSGFYDDPRAWRAMRPLDFRRAELVVAGKQRHRPYHEMDTSFRRQLLIVDGEGTPSEPALLWLTEAGRPIAPDNVRTIFRRANERCERILKRPFEISPHTLRHTFAVHMLSLLIDEQLRMSEATPPWARQGGMGIDAFREHALNPLRVLKALLGHRSVETTFGYLTHIVDVRRSQEGAAASLHEAMYDCGEVLRAAKAASSVPGDDE